MAAFPDHFLDEIRSRLTVSEVVGRSLELKRKGAEYVGLSPFQNENTPSFTVNDAKGFWHDFSTGKHGDVFSFLMEAKGLDFKAAVAECAQIAGVTLPEDNRRKPNGRAAAAPQHNEAPPDDDVPFDPDAYDIGRSQPQPQQRTSREITRTYDYTDGNGALLYQVCRIEWVEGEKRKKTFLQRRPAPDGGWIWGLDAGDFLKSRDGDWYQATKERVEKWKGAQLRNFPTAVKHGLYKLEELREEASPDSWVIIPEGEKDVDTLRAWGLTATTNSGGARNWSAEHAEIFRGRKVAVPMDNDQPGRDRGEMIAQSLHRIAAEVRLIDFASVWPDAPKGADVTDWRDKREGDAGELLALIEQTPAWRPKPFESKMGLRLWSDQDQPGPQYEFIVEDLIPERQLVVIMGESGTGKSFLTFDLAMALARGTSFFGRRVLKPWGVIWCAYEAAEGASSRMRAYRRHNGMALEPLPFAALRHPAHLWPHDGQGGELLINEVRGIERSYFDGVKTGVIIVDTYNAATPGASEIDSEVVSKIRTYFHRVIQETGATLIIVGHTNASGKHRGNEQLTNNVDTILRVSLKTQQVGRETVPVKDADGRKVRTMKVVKQREGQDGEEFDFVLGQVEDGTTNSFGKPRTSCVVLPCNLGRPAAQEARSAPKRPRLTAERAVILQALQKALEEHGESPPVSLRLPKSVTRVVNTRRWKEAYLTLTPDPDAKDDTINKRILNASNQFQELRIIGRINPFVWIVPRKTEEITGLLENPITEEFPDDGLPFA